MSLLGSPLRAYIDALNSHSDPIAHEMEVRARKAGFPIVGPSVGRLLYQLTALRRPGIVFELGSGFGYSALWFAGAMRDLGMSGKVVLTDGSADNIRDAGDYLGRAGLADRVELHCGDALSCLASHPVGSVDIFFVDVDKEGYPDTLEPMMERLAQGGLIVVDNMLWKGKVFADPRPNDAATNGVVAFTDQLFHHPKLWTTMIPIRDGVSLSVRIG